MMISPRMIPSHPTDDNGNSHPSKSSQSHDDNKSGYKEPYCEAAEKSKDKLVTEKPISSSFHIIRDSLNDVGLDDDATVPCSPLSRSLLRTRMSMMVTVPGTDKGIDEDEAPLEAIRKMNLMIKSLINKIPSIKLGPWLHSEKNKINICLSYQKMWR